MDHMSCGHLFRFPEKARFDRLIPKSKIYERAELGSVLRDKFVAQVEQIRWVYKLAPETINLAATRSVIEIQVFRIELRRAVVDHEVLRAIDRAIPFPLIFELTYSDRVKVAAAYKRPSESDSSRWVVGNYFESDWLPEDLPREPLPVALDMAALYEQLLSPLVARQSRPSPVPSVIHEVSVPYIATPQAAAGVASLTLEKRIALAERIAAKTKEIERIKSRLAREKQFNKRVAINTELRNARQELERLTSQAAASVSH
ncbi:DUF4391 domain-containing protein [Pseudomonas mosselii]|uniref:DUF4391 domain-containing protein n=1 Tax=Pseudomonas mosselii TaxID=78327 RepID=UPI000AA42B3A